MREKIGFIGLGNMAKAMINSFLQSCTMLPLNLMGSAPTQKTREEVRDMFGIRVTESNTKVAETSEVLILAVKPNILQDVIAEIRDYVKPDTLIISIAAGKTIDWITEAFGRDIKLVRCMPNTPALIGEGCTGVCVNSRVSQEEADYSLQLMGYCGKASLVPERLMDAVGAVSGSSPAFVFMFIEAMADAAVAAGMPRAQSYEFAAQSVYGSAKLLLESGKHPGELKDMVCSPAGTTIEGVRVLEERGMRGAVTDAVLACVEKSKRI
jgi:pyrroline-5-carboxylate reductase